ncbi:MAG: amidohydrolase family protein [Burkholderiales bacterium]
MCIHAVDHQDPADGRLAVAQGRRRGDANRGHVHAGALDDDAAALFENARALGEPYAAGFPKLPLLTSRDVLRFATQQGANELKLRSKIGSLTPDKEADIIILDAEAINVHPLNVVPGAVVSLMERSNVETVIVAGKVRKWKGKPLDVDLRRLRDELEDSRDFLFSVARVPQDLFRPN